jgi:hypothetical protein
MFIGGQAQKSFFRKWNIKCQIWPVGLVNLAKLGEVSSGLFRVGLGMDIWQFFHQNQDTLSEHDRFRTCQVQFSISSVFTDLQIRFFRIEPNDGINKY